MLERYLVDEIHVSDESLNRCCHSETNSINESGPALMVRAFAAALTDPNPLVQRASLELLQTALPLDGLVAEP